MFCNFVFNIWHLSLRKKSQKFRVDFFLILNTGFFSDVSYCNFSSNEIYSILEDYLNKMKKKPPGNINYSQVPPPFIL